MAKAFIGDKVNVGPDAFWKPGKTVACIVKEVYVSKYRGNYMILVQDTENENLYRVRVDELLYPPQKYKKLRVNASSGRIKFK